MSVHSHSAAPPVIVPPDQILDFLFPLSSAASKKQKLDPPAKTLPTPLAFSKQRKPSASSLAGRVQPVRSPRVPAQDPVSPYLNLDYFEKMETRASRNSFVPSSSNTQKLYSQEALAAKEENIRRLKEWQEKRKKTPPAPDQTAQEDGCCIQ